ncbi:MAG TPA: DUF2283 domain-containing protein [Trichocoleus sp.]|jgi:uncharacterized protein YuzE
MKVIYNNATDVMRIVFKDVPVEDYNEELPHIKIDYDAEDRIVAMEISRASTFVQNPNMVEHLVIEDS